MRHIMLVGLALLLLFITTLLLLGSCVARPPALPAGSPAPVVTVTPAVPADDALPTGWRRYAVPVAGISFACPDDWDVTLYQRSQRRSSSRARARSPA